MFPKIVEPQTTVKDMKSKQLANVLIKILGLSVLVQSIQGIITDLFMMVRTSARGVSGQGELSFYALSIAVMAAVGICLIVKSRCLADFLLKNEDE